MFASLKLSPKLQIFFFHIRKWQSQENGFHTSFLNQEVLTVSRGLLLKGIFSFPHNGIKIHSQISVCII